MRRSYIDAESTVKCAHLATLSSARCASARPASASAARRLASPASTSACFSAVRASLQPTSIDANAFYCFEHERRGPSLGIVRFHVRLLQRRARLHAFDVDRCGCVYSSG